MALKLEEVRALAERVAASHGLDVVDVEYQGGGGKHRTLRVFIEKNEVERAKLRERVAALQARRESVGGGAAIELEASYEDDLDGKVDEDEQEPDPDELTDGDPSEEPDSAATLDVDLGTDQDVDQDVDRDEDEAFLDGLPSVASLEFLSGITHADCEVFSRDFGTVLDVEELVPGTEYLLEVSSPGLDRRLSLARDYKRFTGSLVKLQTFEAVAGNRHWQGRIAGLAEQTLVLELSGKQAGKKAKKGATPAPEKIEIALGNVEKAHLVPEF